MTQTLLASMVACGTALAATPGTLVLNGKTFALTHVYARKAPNDFNPSKTSTYVLAVDRELATAVRTDSSALRGLVFDGALNGIEIELTEGGISWSILSREAMSMSGSQSPDPYKLAVDGDRVRGMVKMEKPHKLGGTEYYFEFPVDAVLEVKAAAAPPTPADKAAARNAASTKAYLVYQNHLRTGDKAGLMQSVDPKRAAMINTPEFPEMLKFIQSMQPKNIEVLRAVETGDSAELTVQGNGGADTGTVKMMKSGGNWLVMKESWKNR